MKTPIFYSVVIAGLLSGCVYDRRTGNYVPPDPLGRALVNAINSDPVYEPREYVVESDRPYYAVRDTRPPRPAYSDPVYIDSEVVWTGDSWNRVPGHWVERPRPGARYVAGNYYTRGGRRYYRSGYWR